mgnify:CR=1 FL=1
MRVITVANRKGGAGKTSISINLAAGLAKRGERSGSKVVLLDFDPQLNSLKTISNTTQYTNIESLAAAVADDELLELLNLERPVLASLVQPAPEGWYSNLYFVPSREALLTEVKRRMPASTNRVTLMRAAIGSLRAFDYVVIDTGPSIDDLLVTILAATDFVLIPVEMDEHSVEGALRLTEKVAEISGGGARPRVLGYVANKFAQRRVGDRNAIDLMQQLFKGNVFQAVIPASIEVRYSQQARLDLYRFNRDCPATIAMAQMVDEAVRRMNGTAH